MKRNAKFMRKQKKRMHIECTHGVRHMRFTNLTNEYYCRKCDPQIAAEAEQLRVESRSKNQPTNARTIEQVDNELTRAAEELGIDLSGVKASAR